MLEYVSTKFDTDKWLYTHTESIHPTLCAYSLAPRIGHIAIVLPGIENKYKLETHMIRIIYTYTIYTCLFLYKTEKIKTFYNSGDLSLTFPYYISDTKVFENHTVILYTISATSYLHFIKIIIHGKVNNSTALNSRLTLWLGLT